MLKKLLITCAILILSLTISAQDTLRVMVYNLLFYGQFTSFCTPQNNHPNNKDGYLRTILAHDLPDIFVVNEMGINPYYHQRIIDSVLHKITTREYARAESQNIANSNLMNMMYYNTEKLHLHSQHIIQTILRDIDLYTLYYRSPELENGDTVFIHCIAAHLKAGGSEGDQLIRTYQINNSLAWLKNNLPPGNFLFMGDFNAKTVNEQAMQNLFYNPDVAYRFYDPVNQLGAWYNNPAFTMYHTQSTHTSGNCHVGGGLDDRFDLIAVSADIMQGNKKLSYIEDSYHTLGQDGLRLNKALLDMPFNNSAPFEVIQALYHNSDHLPVLLSLAIDQSPASARTPFPAEVEFSYNNPVTNHLEIHYSHFHHAMPYTIDVYSMVGNLLASAKGTVGNQSVTIQLGHLPAGLYLVEFKMQQFSRIFKIVKI